MERQSRLIRKLPASQSLSKVSLTTDTSTDSDGANEEIPLPTVKKAILEKILEFCEYIHKNSPPEIDKPLRSSELRDVVNESVI
jgi:hypothetical protein